MKGTRKCIRYYSSATALVRCQCSERLFSGKSLQDVVAAKAFYYWNTTTDWFLKIYCETPKAWFWSFFMVVKTPYNYIFAVWILLTSCWITAWNKVRFSIKKAGKASCFPWCIWNKNWQFMGVNVQISALLFTTKGTTTARNLKFICKSYLLVYSEISHSIRFSDRIPS